MASKPLKLKISPKRRANYYCAVSYQLVAVKDVTEGMLSFGLFQKFSVFRYPPCVEMIGYSMSLGFSKVGFFDFLSPIRHVDVMLSGGLLCFLYL